MAMGKIEDIDTSDVRKLLFRYTSADGTRDIAGHEFTDGSVSVHRVRMPDGTLSATVCVTIYGRASINGDGRGDTWEDALTDAENNVRSFSPRMWRIYAQHVLVGAEVAA
jgi:hypothetical protein